MRHRFGRLALLLPACPQRWPWTSWATRLESSRPATPRSPVRPVWTTEVPVGRESLSWASSAQAPRVPAPQPCGQRQSPRGSPQRALSGFSLLVCLVMVLLCVPPNLRSETFRVQIPWGPQCSPSESGVQTISQDCHKRELSTQASLSVKAVLPVPALA